MDTAIFNGDGLLASGSLEFADGEANVVLGNSVGYRFEVSYRFEEPACPVFVTCYSANAFLYRTALRVGVHNSEDWESVELAESHVLVFKCYA
jgi:hypothetical protein